MKNARSAALAIVFAGASIFIACNSAPSTDTAVNPASSTSASATAADGTHAGREESRAAVAVNVPSGTTFAVRVDSRLASDTSSAGQSFSGALAQPVTVDGRIAIPSGAKATGEVVYAASSGHFKGRSELQLRLTRISYNGHSYDVASNTWQELGPSRGVRTAKVVGIGAGAGALVGALLGRGKGAAIGAGVGAGSGAAAEGLTKPKQVVVASEDVLHFRLTSPVSVAPSSAVIQ
jgi:hypothetical protein